MEIRGKGQESKRRCSRKKDGNTVKLYRSLNATVTQIKNCPFAVNTAVELKNMTATSDITSTPVS